MSVNPHRILVVEDDLSILAGLSMNLKFDGYEVLQAQDGQAGLQRALDDRPDLIVLDLMLPQMNGYEVIKQLRQRGNRVPVVVLSAKGTESDKILGLDLGADDYVVKPFGLQELLARIKAVLRRRYGSTAVVRFGDSVAVDLDARKITRGGRTVDLTAQEFRILEHLVAHPGRIFTRQELISGAWGFDYQGTERTVDNFMRQLRQKLEVNPDKPEHFLTVRGLGYRFEK
jgi:two-component system, OmpR family, alkaline phosphatase synthesis response regulator PhoP